MPECWGCSGQDTSPGTACAEEGESRGAPATVLGQEQRGSVAGKRQWCCGMLDVSCPSARALPSLGHWALPCHVVLQQGSSSAGHPPVGSRTGRPCQGSRHSMGRGQISFLCSLLSQHPPQLSLLSPSIRCCVWTGSHGLHPGLCQQPQPGTHGLLDSGCARPGVLALQSYCSHRALHPKGSGPTGWASSLHTALLSLSSRSRMRI